MSTIFTHTPRCHKKHHDMLKKETHRLDMNIATILTGINGPLQDNEYGHYVSTLRKITAMEKELEEIGAQNILGEGIFFLMLKQASRRSKLTKWLT